MEDCNPTKCPIDQKVQLRKDEDEKPIEKYLQLVKGIIRYVKGTLDYGLVYSKGEKEIKIDGYSDSDLAMDVDDTKSTYGVAFYINDNLVTWVSQEQRSVALSLCEAEFMAATMGTCQDIWIRCLLTEITRQTIAPATLHIDNKSTLDLMKSPVFHRRSKHIDTRFHFIRECVENDEVKVTHVCNKE
ncbi:secreted RxLR effector protein 161-like [Lactuca sativa]|uniref:secreted RxLR effector protein 161-like n=1 Tax=Lactuca sativa TaxID=4236 RepID=UPI001C68CABD|nr:secreted RxLR effector protein 161-like [Lactuca sativa]